MEEEEELRVAVVVPALGHAAEAAARVACGALGLSAHVVKAADVDYGSAAHVDLFDNADLVVVDLSDRKTRGQLLVRRPPPQTALLSAGALVLI
jgi:hypothetical protein